jgi:hypothetical protein
LTCEVCGILLTCLVSFIHLDDAVKPPTINAKLTVGISFIL